MTDAWRSITLTEYEHVVTGPSQSLLRVCGQAPPERAAGPRPTLVMATAAGEARFHPLRAPEDRRGIMRAAYAVPTALIADGGRTWLELSDGGRIDLPEPVEGAARRRDFDDYGDQLLEEMSPEGPEGSTAGGGAPSVSAFGPGPDELGRAREEIRRLVQHVHDLENARDEDRRQSASDAHHAGARVRAAEDAAAAADAEARAAEEAAEEARARINALEHELAAQAPARDALREEIANLKSSRRSLERELDQARDQLRIMTFERDELERQAQAFDGVAIKARERAAAAEAAKEKATSALNELQVWRGELERRLTNTTDQLGAMRAAREADERELTRLREALSELQRRGGRDPNGAPSAASDDELVAMQAQEIQRLAAEVAELRSRSARSG